MARWQIPGVSVAVGSVTVFLVRVPQRPFGPVIASGVGQPVRGQRHGIYDLPRHWKRRGETERRGRCASTRLYDEDNRRSSRRERAGTASITTIRNTIAGTDAFSPSWTCARQGSISAAACRASTSTRRTSPGKTPPARRADVHGRDHRHWLPVAEQRYRMKKLEQVSGTLLPSLGVTVEF